MAAQFPLTSRIWPGILFLVRQFLVRQLTITYENFTMQSTATSTDNPIKIIGKFSPSSGGLKEAGTVTVDVTQVEDGYGEATIKATAANAPTVKAGSNNNQIIVEFTAVGTMDGGAVSLQKPTGWGIFKTMMPNRRIMLR